jgi:hypothetical protein
MYCGKAISVIYSEYVFVALGIQHAIRMRHIVICGQAPLYSIFPYYLLNDTIFEKKITEHNVCFYCLYNFVRNNSHFKKK